MHNFPTKSITIIDEPLCEECKELGYCKLDIRLKNVSRNSSYVPEPLPNVEFKNDSKQIVSLKGLLQLVPLRVPDSRFGDYTKKHLQEAFDSFHQEDYETALLHFLAVLEANSNIPVVFLGTSLCYYMQGDIENAICFSQIYADKNRGDGEHVLQFFEEQNNLKKAAINEHAKVLVGSKVIV